MPVCVVVESFSSIRSTLFDIFGFDLSGDDEYAKLEFSCGTSVSLSMRQYRLFDENIAELQMRYSLSGGHLLSFKD
ncbi:hypothetical protein [Gilvimarinus agarilyticus]|uniref:hypothetical protein n=1 Tax=Gilvimarinus agarilyticus TaxID=679259 RepID=UPI0005A1728D|nr:hypothetical protein [Gilvimarinus agarilyticus]